VSRSIRALWGVIVGVIEKAGMIDDNNNGGGGKKKIIGLLRKRKIEGKQKTPDRWTSEGQGPLSSAEGPRREGKHLKKGRSRKASEIGTLPPYCGARRSYHFYLKKKKKKRFLKGKCGGDSGDKSGLL